MDGITFSCSRALLAEYMALCYFNQPLPCKKTVSVILYGIGGVALEDGMLTVDMWLLLLLGLVRYLMVQAPVHADKLYKRWMEIKPKPYMKNVQFFCIEVLNSIGSFFYFVTFPLVFPLVLALWLCQQIPELSVRFLNGLFYDLPIGLLMMLFIFNLYYFYVPIVIFDVNQIPVFYPL